MLTAFFVFGCLMRLTAQEPAAQSLSLSEAVALALVHNPALQAAGGQVAAAQARLGEAHAAEGTQVRVDLPLRYRQYRANHSGKSGSAAGATGE